MLFICNVITNALISDDSINQLIRLAKILHWETTPEMQFRIVFEDGEEVMNFTDALAEPQVFRGALFTRAFLMLIFTGFRHFLCRTEIMGRYQSENS